MNVSRLTRRLSLSALACIGVAMMPLKSSADNATIAYIQAQDLTNAQRRAALLVLRDMQRIHTENWEQSNATFTSISEDLHTSISCYLMEKGGEESDFELIAHLEVITSGHGQARERYGRFLTRDAAIEHKQVNRSEC